MMGWQQAGFPISPRSCTRRSLASATRAIAFGKGFVAAKTPESSFVQHRLYPMSPQRYILFDGHGPRFFDLMQPHPKISCILLLEYVRWSPLFDQCRLDPRWRPRTLLLVPRGSEPYPLAYRYLRRIAQITARFVDGEATVITKNLDTMP